MSRWSLRVWEPLLLLVLSLTACTDTDEVLGNKDLAVSASEETDDVYWDENGVMEFVGDDGNHYKLVREGPYYSPGSVTIWKNGQLEGVVDFFAYTEDPEQYRWEEDEWADTDDEGFLLATSAGMPGGEEAEETLVVSSPKRWAKFPPWESQPLGWG